jgi:DNA-binding MarR family transcriptional regulator
LVAGGLAQRIIDPADRRYVRLQITAKGRALMQRGRTQRIARLQARLQGLSDSDLTAFRRVLTILRAVL